MGVRKDSCELTVHHKPIFRWISSHTVPAHRQGFLPSPSSRLLCQKPWCARGLWGVWHCKMAWLASAGMGDALQWGPALVSCELIHVCRSFNLFISQGAVRALQQGLALAQLLAACCSCRPHGVMLYSKGFREYPRTRNTPDGERVVSSARFTPHTVQAWAQSPSAYKENLQQGKRRPLKLPGTCVIRQVRSFVLRITRSLGVCDP